MKSPITYPSFLSGWLQVYALLHIVYLLFLWGSFGTGSFGQLHWVEVVTGSVVAVVDWVGIVYLKRRLRFGLYLLVLAPLLAVWVEVISLRQFPSVWGFAEVLSLFTGLLLGLKSGNRTVWSQLEKGIDWAHFRHIYQVAIFLVVLFLGFGVYQSIYWDQPTDSSFQSEESRRIAEMTEEQLWGELDSPRITLGMLSKIEKLHPELSSEMEGRIMALRHILSGHIVPGIHQIESFKKAYYLRKDALSVEQQDILDWFFRQQRQVLEVWRESEGCPHLEAFQTYIKQVIKQRNITEY